jgi:hypothetical protein
MNACTTLYSYSVHRLSGIVRNMKPATSWSVDQKRVSNTTWWARNLRSENRVAMRLAVSLLESEMRTITKILGVSALAAVMTSVTMVQDAEAQRYRRGVGIGLGIVGGAIIAGAIANEARARDRAYYYAPAPAYAPGPGCGHLRAKAVWAEDHGHYGRARYYWGAYRDCRGY